MSRAGSDTGTEFRENLTIARHRLRSLHQAQNPPVKVEYRGYEIVAENPRHLDAYELHGEDGEVLISLERSDFNNADDWVRAFDLAIHESPEAARDWLRNDLFWWWHDA